MGVLVMMALCVELEWEEEGKGNLNYKSRYTPLDIIAKSDNRKDCLKMLS